MSATGKVMYSMSCDHPDGCSAELETYDGGAWLYDSAAEARTAAYDFDWVTDGEHDYCDRHRDFLADDDQIMPYPPPGEALFPEPADPVRCPKCGGPHPFHDPACVVHPDLIQDHTKGGRDA